MTIQAIQTRYAGCHFRSRLEARWAVFFDELGVDWGYEPEGYELSFRRYLPDFLLTECSTFIEVRGANERVDLDELARIAGELPDMPLGRNSYVNSEGVTTYWSAERGPKLMLLGPIPRLSSDGDPAWLGWHGHADEGGAPNVDRWGFNMFCKNRRPWFEWDANLQLDRPLDPTFDLCSDRYFSNRAYMAAASARFEHGESGAS